MGCCLSVVKSEGLRKMVWQTAEKHIPFMRNERAEAPERPEGSMPLGGETGTQRKQRARLKINYAVNMTRVRYDALGVNEENNVAIVLSVNLLFMNKLAFLRQRGKAKKQTSVVFLCLTQNSLMTVIYSFVYLFRFFAEGSGKCRTSCSL